VRKADTPSTLSVPCVRALITEGDGDTAAASAPPKPAAAKPRKRKPKFVF
jgi:hypothetical protein